MDAGTHQHRDRAGRGRPLVASIAVSALAMAAGAWGAEGSMPRGHFVDTASPPPLAKITAECPTAPDAVCAVTDAVLEQRCEVVDTTDLGRLGSDRHLVVRYRRSVTYDAGAGRRVVCETDEAVLATVTPAETARLVWTGATEREFERIGSPSFHRDGRGRGLLSVPYCMNGTGGCAEVLFLWLPEGGWRRLEHDASWEAVYHRLPDGYRPHKSPALDLATLTWEQHLAGPLDPNCCPTGKILFSLSIDAGRLHVERSRIVTTDDPVAWLQATRVGDLDAALGSELFDAWLATIVPTTSVLTWTRSEGGVTVEIDVPSRARHLSLAFLDDPPRWRRGTMTSPRAPAADVARLRDAPTLLRAPLALRPLACPPGTAVRTRPSDAGLFEWCEGRDGRDGPARSWFSTGIYLMEAGNHRLGHKTGRWIECDRFERCASRDYD